MHYFFCWGESFLASFNEFWPAQITRIRKHAARLFRRRPHDDDLEAAAQIRASIIPFEMYNYGLVLVLNGDLWTLEIAQYPPHAAPGERIRHARRIRERREQREQHRRDAAAEHAKQAAERAAQRRARAEARAAGRAAKVEAKRTRKLGKAAKAATKKKKDKKGGGEDTASRVTAVFALSLQPMISMLYNIVVAFRENLAQVRRKLVAFSDQIGSVTGARPLTVRQQLSRWIVPSAEDCRTANIAAWKHDPLPRGAQRERRLFCGDFLPMWLDTIAPIESMFVRDGRSLFGEPFSEVQCVS
ncbi:MAG: hypothetical protein HY054_03070 [Proteobacteria bacterium]|nr:hypothetical protein [Pseudomonadota bacterium]